MSAPLILHLLAALTTAMVAGFLVMYCLTIGGFFSHMVRTGQIEALQRHYAPFRRRTHLKTTYAQRPCSSSSSRPWRRSPQAGTRP